MIRYDTVSLMLKAIEKKSIVVQPKDILTPREAKILQQVDRGELFCPRCGRCLSGDKLVADGIYEGVVIVCLTGCGWREY